MKLLLSFLESELYLVLDEGREVEEPLLTSCPDLESYTLPVLSIILVLDTAFLSRFDAPLVDAVLLVLNPERLEDDDLLLIRA